MKVKKNWAINSIDDELNYHQFEYCVSCKCNTEIPLLTPINQRPYYISGVGQLCQECWKKIYQNTY